jgi:Zn-finger nucleic acid-binding protein
VRNVKDPSMIKMNFRKLLKKTFLNESEEFLSLLKVKKSDDFLIDKNTYCPIDKTKMMEIEYPENSGINIDFCNTCHGIWTNKEITEKILNYILKNEPKEKLEKTITENPSKNVSDYKPLIRI